MLYLLAQNEALRKVLLAAGLAVGFLATMFFTKRLERVLPRDAGREFAHDGAKSAGKARGAGIIFVHVFNLAAFLFLPMNPEYFLYLVLLQACMLTGYLDDAAKAPWSPLKKGILDLVIAVLVAAVYLMNHEPVLYFAFFHTSLRLPVFLFALGIVALVWASINVTNCADGVDGLSGSLVIVTLLGFYHVLRIEDRAVDFIPAIFLFVLCLLAYLWFNAAPSVLMMGDAGSRAMGLFIAITALLSGSPLLYLPLAFVLILDGGLGLLKVALIKVCRVHILKNVRTPLHDHVRKNLGWSNTQCVFRFVIIQAVIVVAVLYLAG